MKRILALCILVVLIIAASVTGTAQDAALEGEAVGTGGNVCPQVIVSEVQNLKAEFYTNLELQLESPDLTSSRLNDLYEDFYDVQEDIRTATSRRTLRVDDISENNNVNANCLEFFNSQINEIQRIFATYVSESATRERNYALIEKYDQINNGLRDLQEDFHDIQSDINTFDTQLPCFVSQCVQR